MSFYLITYAYNILMCFFEYITTPIKMHLFTLEKGSAIDKKQFMITKDISKHLC